MQSISRNFHPEWNEMHFFNSEKTQLSIPVSFTRNLADNGRELESQDDVNSYLVDRKGNEYEPYALAWRYLGMYIDCDLDAISEASYGRRRLEDDVDCSRKVLWAAVSSYHFLFANGED